MANFGRGNPSFPRTPRLSVLFLPHPRPFPPIKVKQPRLKAALASKCASEDVTKGPRLVPDTSLRQRQDSCCHSNCFQTWQLFLPSFPPSHLPSPSSCASNYLFFFHSLSNFFLPFFFGRGKYKGPRSPHTSRASAAAQGLSLIATFNPHPISPSSPGQSETLEQQLCQIS